MGRIIKLALVLAVAAFLGLVAYAYLGDMAPQQVPVSKPVVLDGQ
jgi:predicted small integral membrane protein